LAIWNPDELEDGRTRPEDNFVEGETYFITAAQIGVNAFGDDALLMTIEPETGEEFDFAVKLSTRKDSKWGEWTQAWRNLGVEIGAEEDLVGLGFTATKRIDTRTFNDNREGAEKGAKVERDVHTVLPGALAGGGGAATNGAGNKADNDAVIDEFLEVIDGLAYGPILSKVQAEDKFAALRKGVGDRSLLNKLVEDGRLALEGRTYKVAS